MSEKPILFSAPMVRAILDGSKSQTRRVVKNLDLIQDTDPPAFRDKYGDWHPTISRCPYGGVGTRLWVRETWFKNMAGEVLYRADYGPESYEGGAKGWKPSIHMPRSHSRITLEVTGVRVERLESITNVGAYAEGFGGDECATCNGTGYWANDEYCEDCSGEGHISERQNFRVLWDKLNQKRGFGWSINPWVWVVEFKRYTDDRPS